MLYSKPMKVPIISVQSSYQLHVTPTGVITCDTIIKVPLAQEVIETDKISNTLFGITPVVEILFDEPFSIKIITDKGITVEPFSSVNLVPESNPYMTRRLYLVLPPKTTEIKDVMIETERGVFCADLEIEVMPPPYNYDKALFGVLSQRVKYHGQLLKEINGDVSSLNNRVNNLENRHLFVNRVGISDSPDFFVLPGSGDKTNVLGWEFTFSNAGKKLTLTYQSTTTSNIIFNDIDITDYKVLALAYNSVSSVCSLYGLTQSTTGAINTQRLLASGFGQIVGVSQPLHLFIDNVEQNVAEIGSGFEVFI